MQQRKVIDTKIAVISDIHFGFDYDGARSDDAFIAAEEAITRAINEDNVDLILMPGDIFDSRTPKSDVFAKAIRVLSHVFNQQRKNQVVSSTKPVPKMALSGVPIVAIHGTHERRAKEVMNPVEALGHAGLLVHLHCSNIAFNFGGQIIAIHGMSGVPERYARDTLRKWNPTPIAGAINILMIHQSIDPYVYSPLEPPSLKLEDLPHDFEIIIDGHIHNRSFQSFHNGEDKLLLPGSTLQTQMKKGEKTKGYYIISIDGNKICLDFRELIKQRKFYYYTLDNPTNERIKEIIWAAKFEKQEMEPLIKIKATGSMNSLSLKNIDATGVLLSVSKDFEDQKEQLESIKLLHEDKLSVEDMGLKILEERFGPMAESLFDLLYEEKINDAFDLLYNKEKASFEGVEKK